MEACCGEAWAMSRVEIDGSNRCGRFKLGTGLCFVFTRHLPVAGALLRVRGSLELSRCLAVTVRLPEQLACGPRCSGCRWVLRKLFDLAGTSCKRPASIMHPAKRKAVENEGELWILYVQEVMHGKVLEQCIRVRCTVQQAPAAARVEPCS